MKKNKKKLLLSIIASIILLFFFMKYASDGNLAFSDSCPASTCQKFDFGKYEWRVDTTPAFGTTRVYSPPGYETIAYEIYSSTSHDQSSVHNRIELLQRDYSPPGSGSIFLQTGNISLRNFSTFVFNGHAEIFETCWNPYRTHAQYNIGLKERDGSDKITFLTKYVTLYPTERFNIYGFVLTKSIVDSNRWTMVADGGETGTFDISGLENPQLFIDLYAITRQERPAVAFADFTISSITPPLDIPTGCSYNNPSCPTGYYCEDNLCIQVPPEENHTGCAYNNPPCETSYHCENNQCVVNIPGENTTGCSYNNPPCDDDQYCSNNTCYNIVVDSSSIVYWMVGSLIFLFASIMFYMMNRRKKK